LIKKTIEIQCNSIQLREVFLSWFEDEGHQHFEDWVINYVYDIEVLEFDFKDVDQFIISIDE